MPFGFLKSLNCASGRSTQITKRTRKSNQKSAARRSQEMNGDAQGQEIPNFSSFSPDESNKFVERQFSSEEHISFWDIGNYKYTLKRCDNGYALGDKLVDILSERAKIEEEYSKSLKQWSKKWNSYLDKNSSEGEEAKSGWRGLLEVGNQTADVHLDLCKKIINDPVLKIKDWLKLRYEKNFFNFKQTKEFENEFELAEKSWSELNEKLKRCKKEYFDAIQTVEQSSKNFLMSESNPKYSLDQRNRLEEKAKRAKEEEDKARRLYQDTLTEMDLYKPRHITKMTEVFEKTQNFELERIIFFKQMFLKCHELLQIHNDERFDEMFDNFLQRVNQIDAESDLDWWAKNYGVETRANWPSFEEPN